MTVPASLATTIVVAQVVALALTIILSFAAPSRGVARALTTFSILATLLMVSITAGSLTGAATIEGSSNHWLFYAAASVAALLVTGLTFRTVTSFRQLRYEQNLDSPEVRSKVGDELRDILRREGMALDDRLHQAEADREQFLYALEERHAKQIAGLAQEYQHEAQTILRQLLDQLAAESLHPMVEQRLAEHRRDIESELGAIDAAVAGETLITLRNEYANLIQEIDSLETRVTVLREENPDRDIEEHVAERLVLVGAQVDERVTLVQAQLDAALATTIETIDARILDVGKLLDEKVDAASNPLAMRMAETQGQVEAHLEQYLAVLDQRFVETEEILNTRVHEQEQALETRVLEMEGAIEMRLSQHSAGIERVLAEHDTGLQGALAEQSVVVTEHFSGERDRLIAELSEHVVQMQEHIAVELQSAEGQARETVEATQRAWNQFTVELEERFAETRQEALRAAEDVANTERERLTQLLEEITAGASSDIAAKVETLGREAAWQRAQVERTVDESLDRVQRQAQEAIANADGIFADLDRIGAERVETIRRQAEDALVQSRDYVAQLQDSLGSHLETLRERSGELGDEMNTQLATITQSAHDAATQIETYARDVVDASGRELGTVAEQHVQQLQARLATEFTANIQRALDEQQRGYEQHLAETSQRIMQQVQGDLAGLAEHARSAVTGELDQIIQQAAAHARQSQEQAFREVMNELARHQSELAEQTHSATTTTRAMLEDSLRESRRQLEEAMASMGGHMREELVRFQDEGQRRVAQVIDGLRGREQEMIRDEDRKLQAARSELLRQHQGQLERQVRDLVGGLGGVVGREGSQAEPHRNFTAGLQRPGTPLVGGYDPSAPQHPALGMPAGQLPQPQHPGHYQG